MTRNDETPLLPVYRHESENAGTAATTTSSSSALAGPATRQRKGAGKQQQQQQHSQGSRKHNKLLGSNKKKSWTGLDDEDDETKTREGPGCSRWLSSSSWSATVRSNLHQLRHTPWKETLFKTLQWIRKHPWRALGLVMLIRIILRPSRAWRWYLPYVGRHYLKGGILGNRLERWSMQYAYRETLRQQDEQLRELGITTLVGEEEDNRKQPFRVLELQFDQAYRTLLIQREKRARTLARLEQQAKQSTSSSTSFGLPKVLFIPESFGWVPPRPGVMMPNTKQWERITYNDDERRRLVADACPNLVRVFDTMTRNDGERILVWSLCAVYYFGGVFMGNRIQTALPHQWRQRIPDNIYAGESSHNFASVSFSGTRIGLLAATPRHPIIKCILKRLEQATITTSTLDNPLDFFLLGQVVEMDSVRLQCPLTKSDCCETLKLVDPSESNTGTTVVALGVFRDSATAVPNSEYSSAKVAVAQPVLEDAKTIKTAIDAQLQQKGIQPNWFCMRCLMMPTYGRMSKCTRFCSPAYSDFVCSPKDERINETIELSITGRSHPDMEQIPRIIHQTWFEEIDFDRYPQVARIQNSWRQLGYDYRFYTDAGAREYILDNFPPVFAEAFDVLLPGAYKADFFRYLVLMKEGGVYADVDVLLETSLDSLLRPGLAFFAPLDVVAQYANEAFCLWNGLIGAVPGHPIIITAVERLVNHVLERADIHDMERAICQKDKDSEIWKIHGQPLLLLSGPCALGVSMNEALSRPPLEAIKTGWTGLEVSGSGEDLGDALILTLDKHDLGGFRFSDPDRSLIVASTNLEGLDKTPRNVAHPTEFEKLRQQERKNQKHDHYSQAAKGTDLWGSAGIYADKLVSKFRIKFEVIYNT